MPSFQGSRKSFKWFAVRLFQNLKIFAHNSGGKLTADIVTEVLKDSDVPPVLGTRSACTDWKVLDYDGTCYFHEVSFLNQPL